MPGERIAIRVTPTPATQDLSQNDTLRLARITKLTPERVRDRIYKGKSITIITTAHPKLDAVIDLIRAMGFAVTMGTTQKFREQSHPSPRSIERKIEEGEWKVGETIENLYEVLDIKQGGMGAVYVVRHKRWNTMLAVKSLLERLRENEEDRALFIKEAETWIDIGFHPNIAACYYVRTIFDSPRIFIEYVDGGALGEWLNRRRYVGWDILIDLMVQVCDGLQHAHSKGLVHRDVKPGNCMMTKDGTLKVTDFGLTKRRNLESISESYLDSQDPVCLERESITAAGMGTPGYMAPEMWIPGSEVGPQADIYAFGVMFFELCCGRKPFPVKPGERRDRLALAHVKKPPPAPRSIRADIPGSLETIILKCLNKNPGDRYPSFRMIRDELAWAFEDMTNRRFTREPADEVKLVSDALNNRAVSLMDLNHREEAVRALDKALESDPHHPEAVYNRGLLEWLRTGDPDWNIVVRMEEVCKTPEYVGRGGHLLGRCLLTLGDAPRALKACEVSLSAEDASDEWLKPYGVAMVGCGKETDAISYLENYLADFPTDDEALGWLIGSLIRSGRRAEALERIKALPRGSEIGRMGPDAISDFFHFSPLSEAMVLTGHTGWVTCVGLFPRSRLLITGSRDRTLKIWDIDTGLEQKTIPVVGEPPSALWISPDERLVAVGSAQPSAPIKTLDMETGRFVGNLSAGSGSVTSLAFSDDGSRILTIEAKGVARLWDVQGFKAAATFKIPAHTAAALVSGDVSRPDIIVSGMDRIVKRVRPADSDVAAFERGHKEPITRLTATPDGSRVLSCGRDKQVMVWDGSTGGIVTVFQGHQELVSEVALNPMRNLAASWDPKAGIKVWDSTTGIVFRTFSTGETEVNCIAFTPDGDKLLAGGRDMALRVWSVKGHQIMPDFALARIRPVTKQLKSDRKFKAMVGAAQKAMKRGAFATAYSLLRDSQSLSGYERSDTALDLIIRMKEHGVRLGLHGGWKRKTLETPSGVMDVTFSPSAINFLTAQSDHTIRMWSSKTGECVKVLKGHTNLVAALSYSVNGREALSGSDDKTVRLWDMNTGRNVSVLKGHTDSVSCVAYARNGDFGLSGSWDATLRLWRLPDGNLSKVLKGHEERITSADFVNDSEYIVSAGFDGIIKMWDVASGRVLRDLKGHKDRIMCLSVSPRSDYLLSGSMDGTVRIWDLKTGACIRTVEDNESGVRTVSFSPDQRFFVTGGGDAVVRVWSFDNGKCQRDFQGHVKEITSAEFSSNGRFVISSSADGFVMIWELDWEWRFEDKQIPRTPTLVD